MVIHYVRDMGRARAFYGGALAEPRAAGGAVCAIHEAGGGVPVRVAEVADPEGNGFELRQPVAGGGR